MVTAQSILEELAPLGEERYKRTLMRHRIPEPLYGVKVAHLKKIQKRVKKNHQLALALYDTGVYDARYLAGFIADDAQMSRDDLQRWVRHANCPTLSQCTVAWVAAEGRYGAELAQEWIESPSEAIASCGWATFSALVALRSDDELDVPLLTSLLARVEKTIHNERNEVRSVMNTFVIAVGTYVKPLSAEAIRVGERIGEVSVDVGDTACKVPFAPDYIRKAEQRGAVGRKRKTVKC
jgi:3-methyladenine DNA glycosylase AlkD